MSLKNLIYTFVLSTLTFTTVSAQHDNNNVPSPATPQMAQHADSSANAELHDLPTSQHPEAEKCLFDTALRAADAV